MTDSHTVSPIARARALLREGQVSGAIREASSVLDDPSDVAGIIAADRLLAEAVRRPDGTDWARRGLRLALASSHTSAHLASAVRVAAARHGIMVETYETGYRTYEQQILDPTSALYEFGPDVVVIVADQRELHLPELSDQPDDDLAAELERWRGMWSSVQEQAGARIIMTTFVSPTTDPLGDLGLSLPGARRRQIARLNLALGDDLPPGVALIDAYAVAVRAGADAWFDPRYWYLSKHAVGLGAVGHLATAITDVLAASLGLARKVVVVDLDNTMWGGVIGEDGLGGIVLGGGAVGEAYVDFQEHILALKRRGLVLAVCSKNNPEDARLPFQKHPDMRITLDDVVVFEASWDDKPSVLTRIAATLNVGLDALVFVDDNPVERDAVRRQLPQVGVVELPANATGYLQALAEFPGLQAVSLTEEDQRRTEQYLARSEAASAESTAASREEFLAGLEMTANIESLSETNLTRIVQLIGKTNQLNLTTRRHGASEVEAYAARHGAVVWGVRVLDRFDDHGLVAVVMATAQNDALDIDTFLMSCRVLGRTVEQAVLQALADHARAAGFSRVSGTFVPSGRNVPAERILPDSGFRLTEEIEQDGDLGPIRRYEFDLANEPVPAPYVKVTGPPPMESADAGPIETATAS